MHNQLLIRLEGRHEGFFSTVRKSLEFCCHLIFHFVFGKWGVRSLPARYIYPSGRRRGLYFFLFFLAFPLEKVSMNILFFLLKVLRSICLGLDTLTLSFD